MIIEEMKKLKADILEENPIEENNKEDIIDFQDQEQKQEPNNHNEELNINVSVNLNTGSSMAIDITPGSPKRKLSQLRHSVTATTTEETEMVVDD